MAGTRSNIWIHVDGCGPAWTYLELSMLKDKAQILMGAGDKGSRLCSKRGEVVGVRPARRYPGQMCLSKRRFRKKRAADTELAWL